MAKGGGITFVGALLAYGVRFVMGIVVARSLGSDQFGLYNLALTVASIAAGMALLGLPSALVRYISLFASRRDEGGIWSILQIGLGSTTALSLLLALCMYLFATPIAEHIFHEIELSPLLRLASLMVPSLTLVDILAAATRGFKRMEYTAIVKNVLQPLIKFVLVVIFAITGLNTVQALTAHTLSVVLVSGTLLYFLNRMFSLRRPLRTTRRDAKAVFKFALPLHMDYLIRTFRGNVQMLLLGALNTATTVGVFSVATQVNMIGRMFHQSIVTASMPIVSELYGREDKTQLARFYQTMTKWTFTLNLPLFITVLLFSEPILSIFGEDFVSGALALTILAWGNLVNTGTGICGVVINMTGNTTFNLINSVMLTALTLTLNLLLIPRWGVVGAATATMAAAILVNLLRLTEVFVLFRLLPYNASFLKPVTVGLATMLVAWGIRQLFHTDGHIVSTIVNIALLFAVYVAGILMLGLSQEDRAVLSRITRRVSGVFFK